MTKFSDNESPSVLFAEQGSNPSTPAAGFWRAYFKSTGMFVIDDAGAVTGPFVSSSGNAVIGCVATRTTDQTGVATSPTVTNVSFTGTDEFDTNSYHDPSGGNPDRITIPTGGDGKYLLFAEILWDAGAVTGLIQADFQKNGTTIYGRQSYARVSGQFCSSNPQTVVSLVATDYVTCRVVHTSGSNRTLSGATIPLRFGAIFLGT